MSRFQWAVVDFLETLGPRVRRWFHQIRYFTNFDIAKEHISLDAEGPTTTGLFLKTTIVACTCGRIFYLDPELESEREGISRLAITIGKATPVEIDIARERLAAISKEVELIIEERKLKSRYYESRGTADRTGDRT